MPRLPAEAVAGGALPLARGRLRLEAVALGPVTQVLAFPGRAAQVSEALVAAHGLGFPALGRVERAGGLRLVWSGLDEALALGAEVAPEGAALVDQSDGWAALALRGAGAADVLARLCPADLRPAAFAEGQAVRSLLGHIAALFVAEPDGVLILVPRSMADHAVEDIAAAMARVAARDASGGDIS